MCLYGEDKLFSAEWALLKMKVFWILVAAVWAACSGEEIDVVIEKAAQQNPHHHGDNGNVVVEGDIIYSPEEWKFMKESGVVGGKPVMRRDLNRLRRKAILGKRWPGGVVRFDFKDKFSLKTRRVIGAAMSDYMSYTCLTFQASGGDDNRVTFTDGPGCQSHVGMKGGSQRLHLSAGCRTKGTILHEMGHALGWEHEQARPDRDEFVKIIWKNVEKGFEFNFNKYKKDVIPDWGVGYDYKSVMHYGPLSFSKDKRRELPTIKTNDPKFQSVIGSRESLSFKDIKMANIMYKCNSKCPKKECPEEGFQGKDCECWCPSGIDATPVRHCDGDVIKSEPREIKGMTDYKSDCEDKEGVDCLTWYGFCKNPFWRDDMKRDCPDTCGLC